MLNHIKIYKEEWYGDYYVGILSNNEYTLHFKDQCGYDFIFKTRDEFIIKWFIKESNEDDEVEYFDFYAFGNMNNFRNCYLYNVDLEDKTKFKVQEYPKLELTLSKIIIDKYDFHDGEEEMLLNEYEKKISAKRIDKINNFIAHAVLKTNHCGDQINLKEKKDPINFKFLIKSNIDEWATIEILKYKKTVEDDYEDCTLSISDGGYFNKKYDNCVIESFPDNEWQIRQRGTDNVFFYGTIFEIKE